MKKKLTTVEFHGTKEQEAKLLEIIEKYKDTKGAMMPILQQTQEVSAVSAYAQFVAELYRMEKRTLAGHIQSIVGRDENAYIRLIGRGFADDICCAFYPFCHVRILKHHTIKLFFAFPLC